MRIRIGDKYRDYINTLYVVKSYKDKIITFEVDNGKEKDEVLHKSLFESEINGNRFFRDTSSQTEISDEEIEKESYIKLPILTYSVMEGHDDLNRHLRDSWVEGIKWYREQLRNKK